MKNLKGVYTPDNLDVWSEYWMSDMKDILCRNALEEVELIISPQTSGIQLT